MKTIQELVAKCHEQFDENGSASELHDASLLFQRMGNVWSGAEVCTSEAESPLTIELVELRGLANSLDFVQSVDRGLSLLSEFCAYKALATQSRKTGNVSVAVRQESSAQNAYRRLPQNWLW